MATDQRSAEGWGAGVGEEMTTDAWLALYVIIGAVVGVWLSIKHPRGDDNPLIVAIFVAISIAFWPFILLSFWLEAGDDSL